MISFNWLRTLFYVKPWLAGTLKQSWSTGRGMVQGFKSYIPTPPPQKGGGRIGNALSWVKGKGSNAASYIKGKGSNVVSAFKGDGNWSFMELGYFILAPAFALITIVLSLPVSILLTYYGSFKTSCGTIKYVNLDIDWKTFMKNYDFRIQGKKRIDAILIGNYYYQQNPIFQKIAELIEHSRYLETAQEKINKL